MKKWMITAVLAALLLTVLAPAAGAVTANGTCGEGMTWSLDNYTLTISGSGEVEDGSAWESYKTKIDHVVLTGGVTKLGDQAFYGCDRLKTVDFGDSLVEIGAKAFYNCTGLTYLHLPSTFRTFGAQSFRGCENLKYVYCEGGMPRFNDSCLWTGGYVSVFYPTNNPWPSEYTSTLISSYGGNLGITMGTFDPNNLPTSGGSTDSTEDGEKTDETKAAEETTQETVSEAVAALDPTSAMHEALMAMAQSETAPETTAATEATTEPTTVPTTVETTAETTVETTEETTEAVTTETTEPDAEEKKKESKGWIGIAMVAGVLTMLLAGAMIVRGIGRRNQF